MANDSIKNNIKVERVRFDMTQEQLATAIGVNKATIGNWEQEIGQCSTAYLLEMAKVFGVSTDYLIGLTDDRRRAYENRN